MQSQVCSFGCYSASSHQTVQTIAKVSFYTWSTISTAVPSHSNIPAPPPENTPASEDFAVPGPSQCKVMVEFLCGHASHEAPITRRPKDANKAFYAELCRECQLSEIKYLESVIQEAHIDHSHRLGVRTGDAWLTGDAIANGLETKLFDALCDQLGDAFGEPYMAR